MSDLEKFHLINHPQADEIGSQLDLPLEDENRFGKYVGMPVDASIEGEEPKDKIKLLQNIYIAPRLLERIEFLGGYLINIEGKTKDGVTAKVTIIPVGEVGSKGDITLG
jgi:hypothetical protein